MIFVNIVILISKKCRNFFSLNLAPITLQSLVLLLPPTPVKKTAIRASWDPWSGSPTPSAPSRAPRDRRWAAGGSCTKALFTPLPFSTYSKFFAARRDLSGQFAVKYIEAFTASSARSCSFQLSEATNRAYCVLFKHVKCDHLCSSRFASMLQRNQNIKNVMKKWKMSKC